MYYRKLERSFLGRYKFKRILYNTEIYRITNKTHWRRACIYISLVNSTSIMNANGKSLNTNAKYKFLENCHSRNHLITRKIQKLNVLSLPLRIEILKSP